MPTSLRRIFQGVWVLTCLWQVGSAFAPSHRHSALVQSRANPCELHAWSGDVAANSAGSNFGGCTLQQVDGSVTEWIVVIDGDEADLGKFSEAIYKKLIQDAKQQRFQGFRPGTIPPHIEPTYRAFAMDECARETVLEAIQQNNVRPFETTRSEIVFEDFKISPPKPKKKGKKSKKKAAAESETNEEESVPQWLSFATMKEAVDAGWRPGTSFSFVAKNVKGQKVLGDSQTEGATPLGLNF